jgi:RNA polymerase sigma-70 factor, ECF subfamily
MRSKRADAARAEPAQPDDSRQADLHELLGRVADGDEAALAAVYDQMAGVIYGLAGSMTDDVGWSRELTKGALTEVWRTAPSYDRSEGSARSWIVQTARRHIASRVLAARNGPGDRDLAWPDGDGLDVREPGGQPEHLAVLLALHGGYTRNEISDRLGLAPETVARLIREGLLRVAAR